MHHPYICNLHKSCHVVMLSCIFVDE
uniref:Uncharacterized protein n=1 Tax=Rhizophora mucronata TaxID=61149 RepID=A0A2P2NGT0_RHIMU